MELMMLFLVLAFGALMYGVFAGVLAMRGELGGLREHATELLANVQVAQKKRRGLIDQLVNHAQAFVRHERDVHREAAAIPASGSGLAFVTIVGERFPRLKSDGTYANLMKQLDTIALELQRKMEEYNAAARSYNAKASPWPEFFGWAYGFRPLPYLESFDDPTDSTRVVLAT